MTRQGTLVRVGCIAAAAVGVAALFVVWAASNGACGWSTLQPPAPRVQHGAPDGGIVQLSAGGDQTCARTQRGKLWCWGRADAVDRRGNSALAARLAKLPSVPTRLTGGAFIGCALLANGDAYCWVDQQASERVTGLPALSAVAFDRGLICGIDRSKRVWCVRRHGARAALVPSLGAAEALALALGQMCTRAENGDVTCLTYSEQAAELPVNTRTFHLDAVALLQYGLLPICALSKNGELHCWNPDTGPSLSTNRADTEFVDVENLGAASLANCALQANGSVRCAPDRLPFLGGLPPANGSPRAPSAALDKVPIAGLSGVDVVATSYDSACARRADGWRCWEPLALDPAQSDQGTDPVAQDVTPGVRWAQHRLAQCALDAAHGLRCERRLARVGQTPALAPWFEQASVQKVSLGNDHGCALRTDRSLWCFGANETAEASDVLSEPWLDSPALSREHVADVAVGLRHTCAVMEGGSVICWGDDAWGQVRGFSAHARARALPAPATAVVAGFAHSCALLQDGAVYCWGRKRGAGGLSDWQASLPWRVPLPTPARALAAGGDTTCAVTASNDVTCWGNAYRCVAAQGECPDDASPRSFRLPSAIQELVVGDRHACVLLASQQVQCVGADNVQQLGADLPYTQVVSYGPHSSPCNERWVSAPGSADFTPVIW